MNEGRKEIVQIIFVFVGVLFAIKLFFVQVLDDRYADLANSNAILREVEYPFRGLIYDRNGKLIVYNTPEYDLMIIKKDVKNFDSAKFCAVFGITQEQLNAYFDDYKVRKVKKEASEVKPAIFIRQLSNFDFARIQEHIDEFSGFEIQPRTTRAYATFALANSMGYVSEISKRQLERDTTKIYKQRDYIGQSGLESYYEKDLSGKRGVRFKFKDVKGIDKGSFQKGKWDTLSLPGKDLITTIDMALTGIWRTLVQGKGRKPRGY
jgi:penicillin-binding protein 2